ncbi:MAG: CHAD domain-containing protein [Hyphomonas sp.]|uniref:CHAD domain-containing protein n=1 Tax=Hyphomonas sp. TaxID=87 RepID=UPI003529BFD5
MTYSFKKSDASLTEAVRRVAAGQIATALAELDDPALDEVVRVHQIRKRCKKLRGLVRLVRPGFAGYAEENETFRDLARSLSGLRDAAAGVEVLDMLEQRFAETLGTEFFVTVRGHIALPAGTPGQKPARKQIAMTRRTLEEALARAAAWEVTGKTPKVLSKGVAKNYAAAVDAMALAEETGAAADFHEWRKRVKYHWYHMRLMKRMWPKMMLARVDETERLTKDLGEHHDLHVLRTERLEGLKAADARAFEVLDSLILAEEQRLSRRCLKRGRRLFAEDAEAFARRVAAYWKAWQD